jgi:hypothetical protein
VRRVSTRVRTALSFLIPHQSTTTQRSRPLALSILGVTHLLVTNSLPLVASDMSARHALPEGPRLPSFDHAVEAIVLALGDPPAVPIACLTVLNICYHTVLMTLSKKAQEHNGPGPVHSKTLRPRERVRPLLVQTMRFLATSRTAEQWRALSGAIAPECCFCVSAPMTVQTVPHEPSLMDDPNTLGTLVYNMCFLFTQFFNPYPFTRSYGAWRSARWPMTSKLFPGGAASSMHALGTWLHLPVAISNPASEAELCLLMCQLYLSLPVYAIRGLCKAPAFFVWVCRKLSESLEGGHSKLLGWDLERQQMALRLLPDMVWRCLTDDETRLWAQSHKYAGLTTSDMCTVLCKYVVAVSHRALPDENTSETDVINKNALELLARRLLRILPEVEDARSLPYAQELIAREQTAFERSANVLTCCVFGQHWKDCCSGPSCNHTYAQQDIDFRVCGGCRTMQYCSRRCQTRAWSWPGAGHRDVCWMYRIFYDAQKATPGITRSAAIEKTAKALSPEQLHAVCNNLQTLQASRNARLCMWICTYFAYNAQLHTVQELQEIHLDDTNPWSAD